jgi:hypothetical protein
MMSAHRKLAGASDRRIPAGRICGSLSPTYRDRIRYRAGCAYLDVEGTSEEIGTALDRDASLIRQWRRGLPSPALRFYEHLALLEQSGRDTSPLIQGAIAVALEARSAERLCLNALTREEIQLDAAETVAQEMYLANQGSREDWFHAALRWVTHWKFILAAHGGQR